MQRTTPLGHWFIFVENIVSNSPKVPRTSFLGSNGPLCCIRICKFATITSLSELYFQIRRFILSVQRKKVISMNDGSSRSSWKLWRRVRFDLIISMRDIYINSNLNQLNSIAAAEANTKFKDILPRNISQMITKTILISTRIVISYAMKWGMPLWIWWKVYGHWGKNMTRISQWRESHCRTNTSIRRNK